MKGELPPFFSDYFNNNLKPVLQQKKFPSARRKKSNSKSEKNHKIPATINSFSGIEFSDCERKRIFLGKHRTVRDAKCPGLVS